MRKVLDGWKGGISIGGRRISNLRYADDTTVLAASREELEELLERIQSISAEYGLLLNTEKTKVMLVDRGGEINLTDTHIAGCEVV